MFKRLLCTVMLVVVCSTACSNPNQIELEQQSYVRWYEHENRLEVYAVVANSTSQDISFEAAFVMLDQQLKDAVGFETEQLQTDDRNGKTPFHLIPHNETVFKHSYKTTKNLTPELLSKGVGIKITIANKTSILPIKYGEIE